MRCPGRSFLLAAALCVAGPGAAGVAFAQSAGSLSLVSNGVAAIVRAAELYMPQALVLTETRPASLKEVPPKLRAPLYGILPIGASGTAMGRIFHVIVDEPDGADAALYIDTNGDGDLTNDPRPVWKPILSDGGLRQYDGSGVVDLGPLSAPGRVTLWLHRFDKRDAVYSAYANSVLYYADYGRSGAMRIGGQSYHVMLYDPTASGDFRGRAVKLLIDLNADGIFNPDHETADAALPFSIAGKAWQIEAMTPLGDTFRLVKSQKPGKLLAAPPDLRVGKQAPSFTATDMDGKPLAFPSGFAGRVIMLDFWATFCEPCMQEMPGLVAAYAGYGRKGFEVLGISVDAKDQAAQVRTVMKEKGMVWPEVYEGASWESSVARMYVVDEIPTAYLVDGDTGRILATGDSLTGGTLLKTVERALRKKGRM